MIQARQRAEANLRRNAEEVQRWMRMLKAAGYRLEVDLGGGNYVPVELRYDPARDMRLAQDNPVAEEAADKEG